MITSISSGNVPYVNIKNSKKENIWELFFEQPIIQATSNNKILQNDPNYIEISPKWDDIYNKKTIKSWGAIQTFS